MAEWLVGRVTSRRSFASAGSANGGILSGRRILRIGYPILMGATSERRILWIGYPRIEGG